MKNFFNYEGTLFSSLSRFADLIWLNILFLVCSLPIITIGASTTALYYVTLKMARDEEGYITKSFFKSFKENFLQATGIWLIFVALGLILVADLRIISLPEYAALIPGDTFKSVVFTMIVAITIILAFIFVYVFPVLARFVNSIKNTIKNAFLMSLRHLPFSFLLILIPAVPLVLMYFNPVFYFLILIMFSVQAYISSKILVKIFDNYMPKEEDEGTINKEIHEEEG